MVLPGRHFLVQLRDRAACRRLEQTRHKAVDETGRPRFQQRRGKTKRDLLMLQIGFSGTLRMGQEPSLQHGEIPFVVMGFYLSFEKFLPKIGQDSVKNRENIHMSGYDQQDLRILEILQNDASLPIAEIADRVHLSQNACWRRIKQLEEEGFIAKRVALLDPAKLGVGTTVFVTVKAGEHTEKWLENFSAAVRKIPEVIEFYRLTGEIDYLLKLQVADIADYDRIYKQLIRSAKLMDVSSAFAMEELKRTTAIPLPRR